MEISPLSHSTAVVPVDDGAAASLDDALRAALADGPQTAASGGLSAAQAALSDYSLGMSFVSALTGKLLKAVETLFRA